MTAEEGEGPAEGVEVELVVAGLMAPGVVLPLLPFLFRANVFRPTTRLKVHVMPW